MRLCFLLMAIVPSAIFAAGPISKFDSKTPTQSYSTSKSLEDVERCLIDMDGMLAPSVYRQPDKPNDATLLWFSQNRLAIGRIDLHRNEAGTHVKSWMPAKQVASCAQE